MRLAYELARASLPLHSSRFSRRDYTLPQLFACLVVKDQLKRSYRGVEAFLQGCPEWLADIGLDKVPDHNTLCRAARALLSDCRVNKALDTVVAWAQKARMLKLDTHPVAIDSTTFDSHHVSRHFDAGVIRRESGARPKTAKKAGNVRVRPRYAGWRNWESASRPGAI